MYALAFASIQTLSTRCINGPADSIQTVPTRVTRLAHAPANHQLITQRKLQSTHTVSTVSSLLHIQDSKDCF